MNCFKKSENVGSFDFCHGCPTNKNCCTRMRTHSSIDNAIVFNEEINLIEQFSGVNRVDFLQVGRYPEDSPFQTLKHEGPSGCHFHKGGRCEIYSVRPLDCRFFPFDIIENDEGHLQWIVYLDVCPVDYDYLESFRKLKAFFDLPKDLALSYSKATALGMEDNKYLVLEHVYPVASRDSSESAPE